MLSFVCSTLSYRDRAGTFNNICVILNSTNCRLFHIWFFHWNSMGCMERVFLRCKALRFSFLFFFPKYISIFRRWQYNSLDAYVIVWVINLCILFGSDGVNIVYSSFYWYNGVCHSNLTIISRITFLFMFSIIQLLVIWREISIAKCFSIFV